MLIDGPCAYPWRFLVITGELFERGGMGFVGQRIEALAGRWAMVAGSSSRAADLAQQRIDLELVEGEDLCATGIGACGAKRRQNRPELCWIAGSKAMTAACRGSQGRGAAGVASRVPVTGNEGSTQQSRCSRALARGLTGV